MATQRWLPLESNPDVMNKYVHDLGMSEEWNFMDIFSLEEDVLKSIPKPVASVLLLFPKSTKYVHALGLPEQWQFMDVWGLDAELLVMMPKPIVAVLLLYPLSKKAEETPLGEEDPSANMYFIKQTIGNACGTIALIHSVCNNGDVVGLSADKHLGKFLEETKSLSPEERAKKLEEDSAFGAAHDESAQEGQTKAPSRDEKVNLHFVAFVHNNGGLFELDGRKGNPIRHGNTSPDNLLEDSAVVIKKFMERDPDSMNFTVVALAKA